MKRTRWTLRRPSKPSQSLSAASEYLTQLRHMTAVSLIKLKGSWGWFGRRCIYKRQMCVSVFLYVCVCVCLGIEERSVMMVTHFA